MTSADAPVTIGGANASESGVLCQVCLTGGSGNRRAVAGAPRFGGPSDPAGRAARFRRGALRIFLARESGLSRCARRRKGGDRRRPSLLLVLVGLRFLFLAGASHLTFRHIILLWLRCDDAQQRAAHHSMSVRSTQERPPSAVPVPSDLASRRAHLAGGVARRASG
jgi:hypothetical protein